MPRYGNQLRGSRFGFFGLAILYLALWMGCGGGSSSPNPPPTVQSPQAIAGGPYSADAGQTITFDGSKSSDPGGLALTYAWDFGDSATSTVVKPTHVYAAAGTFTVGLTVTNSKSISSPKATVTATITALPIANAGGPYAADIGQTITFDASKSSAASGLTLTYAWTFGDGAAGTGVKPTHTYTAPGSYNISLTVTDSKSGTSSLAAQVSVAIFALPVAGAGGPYVGAPGQSITFDGSKSTSLAGPLTYTWNFGDGTTSSGSSAMQNHVYAAVGSFTATLTATDPYGGSGTATTGVTVESLPIARAGGPYASDVGLPVTFDGSKSTATSGTISSYAWDFGDGSIGVGVAPSHIYGAVGTYAVNLTVTDSLGITSTPVATTSSIVSLPQADTGGPYATTADLDLALDGSNSKSFVGDGVLTYDWHFGDNTPDVVSEFVKHNYGKTGSFTVNLTVTDSHGGSSTMATTATIDSPAVTSTCNFSLSGSNSASGTTQECTLTYYDAQGFQNRKFRLHIPANYVTLNGNGVVYFLHGSGGTDSDGLTTGWVEKSDSVGFLAVFPQATASSLNGSTQWADFFSPNFTTPPDDSTFLQQLIDHIENNLFAGGKKVYIAGFSSGGYMAHRAAIDLSDRVAAIAVYEGALMESPPATTNVVPQPKNGIPVSVVMLHGDTDKVVPYCGDNNTKEISSSLDDTFTYWAAADACAQIETQTLCTGGIPSSLAVQGKTATNCAGSADVIAYRLDFGTHRFYDSSVLLDAFPGTANAPYNPNFVANSDGTNPVGNNSVDIAWNFFLIHPKP